MNQVPSGQIDLGDRDGAIDPMLAKAFVSTLSYRRLSQRAIVTVEGRKGSGKSAFARYEQSSRPQSSARIISADSIHFLSLVQEFASAMQQSGLDARLLVHAWTQAFTHEAFDLILTASDAGILTPEARDIALVRQYLGQRYPQASPSQHQIFAEKLTATILGVLGKAKDMSSKSSVVEAVDKALIPSSAFLKAKAAAIRVMASSSTPLFLAFDGMDRFYDSPELAYDPKSHHVVQQFMMALLFATGDLVREPLFQQIDLKVMLPLDRIMSLHFKDRVKTEQHLHRIEWVREELLQFVASRIALSLKEEMGDPWTAWYRVFPPTIQNQRDRSVREDSFSYILRHTMLRPRDFQVHWKCIRDAARDGIITEDALRDGIKNGCEELASFYLDEWAQEYPFIRGVLDLFRGMANVLPYDDKAAKILGKGRAAVNAHIASVARSAVISLPFSTTHLINQENQLMVNHEFVERLLYAIGFLGKLADHEGDLRTEERRYKTMPYWCWFSCYQKHPALKEGDRLLIHPIFYGPYDIVAGEPVVVGPG